MRDRPGLVLSAILLVAATLPPAARAADGALDQLSWLAGCWTMDNAEAGSGEQWMPAAGGMLMGMSRTVRGGKAVGWEFMRIGPTPEGKLAFFAQPSGKPPDAFAVLKQTPNEVVFENLAHAFPQRVIYRLESPDKLHASIEGTRNGALRSIPYPMTRVSCGTSTGRLTMSPELAKQQVADTERAFAKTMADRDLKAFASFVAEDTVFFSGPTPLHGKKAVVDFWSRFYTAAPAPFSWAPEQVEVLASGDLAISSGPVHNKDGKLVSRFTSIWRLEAPGQWRIVFDKGSEVCDCKP